MESSIICCNESSSKILSIVLKKLHHVHTNFILLFAYSSEEHSKDLSKPEKKKTWNSDGLGSIKWTCILTFQICTETNLEGIIIGIAVTWPDLEMEILLEQLENIGELLTMISFLKMTWLVTEDSPVRVLVPKRNFKVFEEVCPTTSMKVSFIF